jgi:hypothetical protein
MSITINGSGPITGSDRASSGANTDITALSSIASINGGQLAGTRNVIINGACNVQQRSSLVASLGVTGYGGPDRFYTFNSGAGGQFTQAASTLTFGGQVKDTVRQTVNTAITTFTTTNIWSGITQVIEGFNSYHLKGKPFVVSFIFNTNLTGTYSVSVKDGPNGYTYVSTFAAVANTPLKVSVSIEIMPTPASIPRTNAAGLLVTVGSLNQATYQTSTLNTWLTGNFYTASTQSNWAATVGNFIELTELQLEEGTVATTFERRSYGFELFLCQRYYQSAPIATGFIHAASFSTNRVLSGFTYSVPMRASPSASCPANAFVWYSNGGAYTSSAVALSTGAGNGISVDVTVTSTSGSAGVGQLSSYALSAEL